MRRFPWLLGLTLVACQSAASAPVPSASAATRVDLVYVQDNSVARLLEMDWTGKIRGAVAGQITTPSADGSRFLRTGDRLEAQDWQGHVLGQLDANLLSHGLALWADDGQQLCAVVVSSASGPTAGGGMLWIGKPGQTGRVVGHVGSSGSGPGIAACSVKNNRAVVAGGDFPHWPPMATRYLITTDIQVIDLNTGAIVSQHDYPVGELAGQGGTPDWILASVSPDARYVAESGVFNGSTTIRDLVTGKPLTQTRGSASGFSWDGSRVVVTVSGSASGAEAEVISWADKRIIWQGAGNVQGIVARPHSADVMLSVVDPVGGLSDLIVVDGAGAATTIARNVMMVSPCPCPAGA